ncbi:hypothetical protein QL285_043942 [Trifolium repens]|nr:hypothetical protein QL285_043942 [Trifolium repens]
MSSSTSIESFEGSLPNDGEECLNIVNSTIDLDANTNEGAFTNESFEGSLPNDGEECLNIVNSTSDWLRVMHGIKKKPKVKQVPIEIELLLR